MDVTATAFMDDLFVVDTGSRVMFISPNFHVRLQNLRNPEGLGIPGEIIRDNGQPVDKD
jgi:hypothetical protein